MAARILDGKALAEQCNAEIAERVSRLARPPGLAVVLVGEDAASKVYVRNKGRSAAKLGFVHRQVDLPADASEAAVLAAVDELGADPSIDGILVQLPLPRHINTQRVMDHIPAHKDVDGITATSAGLLSQGRPSFVACTPQGSMRLIALAGATLTGANAVVIGRSNIVGRPMAMLLEQANATVTVCHSRSRDLAGAVQRAEFVIAAVGQAGLVRGEWIREGAVVIDVGMNRTAEGKLTGDVEYEAASQRAAAITPVPGGVGPMTIAMLMQNTVLAAERRS